MPRPSLRAVATALVLTAFAGCNPIYYAPSTQNVPLLGPGEFTASAAASGNQVEVQGAYAFAEHVGVQVNGGMFNPDDLENGDGGSGRYFEGGLGYLSSSADGFGWEVYGLLAVGSFENHFPSTVDENPGTSGEIEGNLSRFAVQPVFGYRTANVEIAVSSRVVGLSYEDVRGDLVYDGEDQAGRLERDGGYLLLEPALTVRAGLEVVKVQVQVGGSYNLTDPNFRQEDSAVTVGLFVRLRQ